MDKKNLVIFSQYYIEIFLVNELKQLSLKFHHIYFFVLNKPNSTILNDLPPNITLLDFEAKEPVYLRKLVFKYWRIFMYWFLNEFLFSPFRMKYIFKFKLHFFSLAGQINTAILLNKKLEELKLKNSKFYSFWFDDWGSVLSIVKKLDKKFEFSCRMHLFDFEEEFSHEKYIPFRYTEISKPKNLVPISNYASNYISKKYKIDSNTFKLGVYDNGNNPISETKKYCIVSCSSLSWYKRPILLAQLIANFKIDLDWYHFGDGELNLEFKSMTDNLPKNISFKHFGLVDNSFLLNFYKTETVDLVLNVSEFEGIPFSLMEAISFAIPIVGCNICGVPEIVNNQTGLLIDKHFDIQNTALQIQEFMQSKSRDQEFRNGIKNFWFHNFNADKNAKITAEFLYNN